MVAPTSKDQLFSTSFKMGYLARAESELKDYQVYSRDQHGALTKKRVDRAQEVFDTVVIEMTQQSHILGTKAKSTTPTANPKAPFPPVQLVATTDPTTQNDFVSVSYQVV